MKKTNIEKCTCLGLLWYGMRVRSDLQNMQNGGRFEANF